MNARIDWMTNAAAQRRTKMALMWSIALTVALYFVPSVYIAIRRRDIRRAARGHIVVAPPARNPAAIAAAAAIVLD